MTSFICWVDKHFKGDRNILVNHQVHVDMITSLLKPSSVVCGTYATKGVEGTRLYILMFVYSCCFGRTSNHLFLSLQLLHLVVIEKRYKGLKASFKLMF